MSFVLCILYFVLGTLGIGEKVRKLWLLSSREECFLGTVDEGSDSSYRYLQDIADLFVALVFSEKKDCHGPVFLRKRLDQFLQCSSLFITREMQGNILFAGDDFQERLTVFVVRVEAHMLTTGMLPEKINARVMGDTVHPAG